MIEALRPDGRAQAAAGTTIDATMIDASATAPESASG
jgi:hypothetical protein